jgi:hypothetical protein
MAFSDDTCSPDVRVPPVEQRATQQELGECCGQRDKRRVNGPGTHSQAGPVQQALPQGRSDSRRQQVIQKGVQPAAEILNAAEDARLLGTGFDIKHLHRPVHVGILRKGTAILVRTVDAKPLQRHLSSLLPHCVIAESALRPLGNRESE